MSLERAPLEQDTNATSTSWYAPLAMLVAWLANLFAHITRMKRIRRTTKFKPNWADHWDGLRNSEWRRDQLITQCTAHVLAGGSLDDDKPVDILPDPPAGYGGPCPRTPFEMNRRFLYLARFLADPAFFIRRRIARIVKRERIDLVRPRLAHGSTDAALCAAAHHELARIAALFSPRSPLALILSSAQSARPSKDERGHAHARGPPTPPQNQ